MTDKQPLALRQADALEDFPSIVDLMNAAATIRHLHEVNEDLLNALKEVVDALEDGHWQETKRAARAAIAKATTGVTKE